jgi:hypothetical protein
MEQKNGMENKSRRCNERAKVEDEWLERGEINGHYINSKAQISPPCERSMSLTLEKGRPQSR